MYHYIQEILQLNQQIEISQFILDSTGLANIVDPTQSYLQHSDVQQFVMNYTVNE